MGGASGVGGSVEPQGPKILAGNSHWTFPVGRELLRFETHRVKMGLALGTVRGCSGVFRSGLGGRFNEVRQYVVICRVKMPSHCAYTHTR